jgi:hypothetical protein
MMANVRLYRVIINISYIIVGCDSYKFAASLGFVNLTLDILHLSLCSFYRLLFFK